MFTFKHFFLFNFHCLTYSALYWINLLVLKGQCLDTIWWFFLELIILDVVNVSRCKFGPNSANLSLSSSCTISRLSTWINIQFKHLPQNKDGQFEIFPHKKHYPCDQRSSSGTWPIWFVRSDFRRLS